jgi:D-beta-D-heptose 7-phosphate kinase/D-beta-D-heptose 1-phosphate adenosyltransferase
MSLFEHLIPAIPDAKIACIGDIMLDVFLYGRVERISPEASTPVILVEREDIVLGGVGNVARNVLDLGGQVSIVSVIGEDVAAQTIRSEIARYCEAAQIMLVIDSKRPTTQKTRYVSDRYKSHLLRADREISGAISGSVEAECLFRAVESVGWADAVVVSDYAKGVLTPALVKAVIEEARRQGKPVVVDPKSLDVSRYAGATVVTPNKLELERYARKPLHGDEDVVSAAGELLGAIPCKAILTTRSEEGMTLVRQDAGPVHVPASASNVVDVSGAGDTVAAVMALVLSLGADLELAARVANAAAGVVIGKAGTATLTALELQNAVMPHATRTAQDKVVLDARMLDERLASWRSAKLRVGFTNGCFDLLHPGHVHVLAEARAECDRLVVGINSDASVKRLKGSERPVQNEIARAEVLAALESVDLVVIFDEDTPLRLIEQVRPTVLVKGGDYDRGTVVGADFVEAHGGKVHLVNLLGGHSSSRLIQRSRAGGATPGC